VNTGYACDHWEPLPRDLDAIKAWYHASQVEDDPYRLPRELPARVVYQIQMSLQRGLPLYADQMKRMIESAQRLDEARWL
jgi:hypothetical protein